MKRSRKLFSCIILVIALCAAFVLSASAGDLGNGSPVNGGITAEITSGVEEDGSVPVSVVITNTNAYEVEGIEYKLTATENGKLSGKTAATGINLIAGDSFTVDLSLGKQGSSDDVEDVTALILLCQALLAFVIALIKYFRQTISIGLCVLTLSGTAAVAVPASFDASSESVKTTFTVTEDVVVDDETIKLTLKVSLPGGSGNHLVSFVDSDGNDVKTFSVPDGATVEATEIPLLTKDGSSFEGWFLSPEATERFYSDDPVKKDITVYPGYSELITDEYSAPVYHEAGIVLPEHKVVILSESAITADNLSDYATLEVRFGAAPSITVTALGDGKYELSGVYPQKGVFCWKLTDDKVFFDGLDSSVREYGFTIIGEETEIYNKSDELIDIAACDFISLEKTDDDYVGFLTVLGNSFAVGDKLGIIDGDGNGEREYYKVTEILDNTIESGSGKILWKLQVTPCTIEEVYDEIDINLQNEEAEEIIDLSKPEDTQNFIQQLKNSEEIRVYADYIASAVNDSATFQQMAKDSNGNTMYMDFTSDTMLAAAENAKAGGNNTANVLDETFELVGGIDISKPGVSVDISVSPPKVKLDDFNSYWDKRYAEVGEKDPKTGEIVNKGKENYFGKRFASIETEVTIGFSVNGGDKSVKVEAKLNLKQYVKICCGISGKLEIGTQMYKNLQLNAGGTAYTETSVDMSVKLFTADGNFDISEEIDDIVSAAEGEKYESDNAYIRRFRSLYNGTDNDFIEVYRKDICAFRLAAGPVEVDIPVAFVIRFGLSAGVGIGYDYRTTYSVGVYKERESKVITPYYSSGVPAWDFNFYVAGHVGVKLGIEAEFGISITGCSKIFKIGVEAEFGIRADFYGYFLLSHTKEWKSYTPVTNTHGAYYFATKFYIQVKLFAKAFTYEKKWELYSYEKTIYSAGNRYVLLDFNARKTEPKTIVIPVTADTPLTKVKDGKYTYDTVCVDLSKYYNSLGAAFFDLQKSNEVFNKSSTNELLDKYVTFSTAGILRLRDGAAYADSNNLNAHLSPSVLNSLLTNESTELDTTVTFVYNGPMFNMGGSKPSVTYKFKFVSQKYLTGKRFNVNYWVDGNLYQTKQYVEGTSIPFWDSYVTKEYCESIGVGSAAFQLPSGAVAQDMDLYAKCFYAPNNVLVLREKSLNSYGLTRISYIHNGISKGSEIDDNQPVHGLFQPYFIGWDLEGDNSDELNVPIPGQNTTYTYNAVYSEIPEYIVTVVDGTTGITLSQDTVTLGEAYTPTQVAPPDDGRIYSSTLSCESGSYLGNFRSLQAGVVMYPTSDITLVWKHEVNKYQVSFYVNNDIHLTTQYVNCGEYIVDPVGENQSQLDYYDARGGFYKFKCWHIWNGDSFVDASVTPITGHSNIYAQYQYMGIYYDIELLDEDGETSLYSGKTRSGVLLNSLYYRTKLPDTEKNYELCWKSVSDGSVGTEVTKSGTYILTWLESERKYTVQLDSEAQDIAQGAIAFEGETPYSELRNYIENQIGDYVPIKQETDYVTYTYDGFELYCDTNSGGEYGKCTVYFRFVPVPKQCMVTYDVTDSAANTGTLWYGQDQITLTDGVYSFSCELSETDSSIDISYQAVPNNRNLNFAGWDFNGTLYTNGETLSLVGFDSVRFTAVYEIKPFAVTFEADGGEFTGDTVIYANDGESIALPIVAKSSDAQYNYRFLGWKDEIGTIHTDYYNADSEAVLTAVYEKTLRNYAVTFNAGGGFFTGNKSQITVNCDYGSVPEPEIPQKASTATEKYTFAGWSPSVASVTGAAEYTATWSVTKLYTVTFNAGDGEFAADKSVLSYTVEENESFDISSVPVPYYNYNGEVRGFIGWSPADTSVIVTEDTEYTAVWSEPKTAVGITVSDGVRTEDVAASLTGAQSVPGYSFEYITDVEGVEPFFVLRLTASGLTLSGEGTVDFIELTNANVTFKNLVATGVIQIYEKCDITIDGNVTLNSSVELAKTPGAVQGAEQGKLRILGADSAAKLIVNSSGDAIRSFNGDIEMVGLNAEITANESTAEAGEAANTSTAIGSLDSSFNIDITDCTLLIHKGYLSGNFSLTDTTVEFDDNDYNGIFCYSIDYSQEPVMPQNVVSLTNSSILFRGKAYINVCYLQYFSNPSVEYGFFKKVGEDADGNPIVGRFTTTEELVNELETSAGAWMIDIDTNSSIEIFS